MIEVIGITAIVLGCILLAIKGGVLVLILIGLALDEFDCTRPLLKKFEPFICKLFNID